MWRDEHGAFYLVDHTGTRGVDPTHTEADQRPATPSRLEANVGDVLLDWAA